MTQEHKILRDLLAGKRITPIDALNDYGCFRLGARIFDIKARGYNVQSRVVRNKGKSFAEYWLNVRDRKAA